MEIILQHYLSLNRMMFTSLPTKKAVINELIRLSREDGKVPDEATFRNALLRRESLMSTGIGYGLAIPHVKLPQIQEFFITIGIHQKGVDWDSMDSKPVFLIFLIAGPDQQEKYLRLLAKLTLALKNPERRQSMIRSTTRYEVLQSFEGF